LELFYFDPHINRTKLIDCSIAIVFKVGIELEEQRWLERTVEIVFCISPIVVCVEQSFECDKQPCHELF
jgi:hypothetical protein